MIKVCFLSWHFKTPEVFLDYLRKMTPRNSGVWKNMVAITNPEEADFCVVFDGYSSKVSHNRFIYIGQHPYIPNYSPSFRKFENKDCLLAISLDKFVNPGEWWIDYDYDTLLKLKPMKKSKKLACVMTYQLHNDMYAQRPKFAQAVVKEDNNIDIYGRPEENFINDEILRPFYRGSLGVNIPDGTTGEHTKGKNLLINYEYSLEFDVGQTMNYFSERFYDALLLWTCPIYFGSINVQDFIPQEAFHYVDINDLSEAKKIKSIVELPRNLKAISEARDLLLNKYQTWAYIHDVVNNLEKYQNEETEKTLGIFSNITQR